MQLVEQHVIGESDPRYSVIDEAAFKSKNLYNAGNYEVRQSYIHTGKTSPTMKCSGVCSPMKPTKLSRQR
jgi:hypothetical protein